MKKYVFNQIVEPLLASQRAVLKSIQEVLSPAANEGPLGDAVRNAIDQTDLNLLGAFDRLKIPTMPEHRFNYEKLDENPNANNMTMFDHVAGEVFISILSKSQSPSTSNHYARIACQLAGDFLTERKKYLATLAEEMNPSDLVVEVEKEWKQRHPKRDDE